MYSVCILSRGWNTSEYTQNTLRYTYPPPHTCPDPCASGIHQDTTGYNRIHPLVRIPTGCTQYLQIRPEYEEDLVSASYSPHCSRSTGPAAQGPASAPPPHRWSRARPHAPAIQVDDTVDNDDGGTSKEDAKKSDKKKGKAKEVPVKKEKIDEQEPPAKRQRKAARR